jgi:hypothetical protein
MTLDLGKEPVEGVGRGDSVFQSAALTEGHDVFGGIVEADAISGAMSAEDFDSRGGHIGLEAGHINLFSTS